MGTFIIATNTHSAYHTSMPKHTDSSPHKRRELSLTTRSEIVTWYNAGLSYANIAQRMKLSANTIGSIVRKWKKTGLIANQPRTGRPPKVTPAMVKRVDRFIRTHDDAVPKEIQEKLHLPVTPRTVYNIRRSLGYVGTHGKPQIQLSPADKEKRVKWCKKHRDDKFTNVIFSDEKPFELYKRRRRSYAKKGQQRVVKPKVKYPPKIQCWGGICRLGKTQLAFWMGRPKSKDYCDTLERCLLPANQAYYPRKHRFLQDRDSTHTSAETSRWLDRHHVKVVMCPARSPDLNPIEMIWNTLEYKVMAHNPTTEGQLREWIIYEWDRLDLKLLNKTINKVIERIPKVIATGGKLID